MTASRVDDDCDGQTDEGACDDGDACTKDVCVAGVCAHEALGGKGCDDGNPCTDDACDQETGCVVLANAVTCSDGDACTVGDACKDGKCAAGQPKDCDDGKPCAVYGCDAKTGQCSKKAAKDGAACGGGKGACNAGACVFTDKAGRTWGLVPAGTFFMGCNGVLDKACTYNSNEQPQHKVTITKPFWMGLREVSVWEYKACVDGGGAPHRRVP